MLALRFEAKICHALPAAGMLRVDLLGGRKQEGGVVVTGNSTDLVGHGTRIKSF